MELEVFGHEALVVEVHLVGNFLHAEVAVLEHESDFLHHIRVNPFVGRAPAHLLHHFEEVFGRYAHLSAVPAHLPLLAVMFGQELDELEEAESELDELYDEQQASYERICDLSLKLCKKYKKQRRRIKEAGRYIDQSDTITSNDKANLKKILHIK